VKTVLGIIFALLLVGLVQNALTQAWSPLGRIDGLMMLTGFLALRLRFVPAVATGAVAGLVQDSLAGGLIGLHAFAKTVVAAVLGSIGGVLMLRGQLAEALIIGVGTFAEGLIVRSLLLFLGWPGLDSGGLVLGRSVTTGLVMGLLLVGVPRARLEWKARRGRRRVLAR